MRDLNLDTFSREVRDKLRDKGIELPRHVVNHMVKSFFKHAEKTASLGEGRFMLWGRNLTTIYNIIDKEKLCNELAIGENVLTADHLIRINKMQRNAKRFYKRMALTLPE
jgi:hypothetical protein